MSLSEHVLQDYASLSLSLKVHPVSFIREKLSLLNVSAIQTLAQKKNGDFIKVAGLVLVRQRPETAKGVWFITIEDETGTANLIAFSNIVQQFKKELVQSRLLMVEGKLQIEGDVIHVIISKCYNITKMLSQLHFSKEEELQLPAFPASDALSHPKTPEKNLKEETPFYKGRNFH